VADLSSRAERRDEFAADRDDASERRDAAADIRDEAAEQRDTRGEDRDKLSCLDSEDLDVLFWQVRGQVRDQFARIENIAIDPADWPDLTPAGLAHLRAHVAERRGLAELSRAVVIGLLDDLRDEIRRNHADRVTAALARSDAARDRDDSAFDRRSSAQDRDLSARDRGQATIEREQAGPADVTQSERLSSMQEPLTDAVARAVAESQQRIADSRSQLTRSRDHANSPASTAADNAPSSADG
jgi:hypothetical protein